MCAMRFLSHDGQFRELIDIKVWKATATSTVTTFIYKKLKKGIRAEEQIVNLTGMAIESEPLRWTQSAQ